MITNIYFSYPSFRTRLASTRYCTMFVPISDRQNTAISTLAFSNGTCDTNVHIGKHSLYRTSHNCHHTLTTYVLNNTNWKICILVILHTKMLESIKITVCIIFIISIIIVHWFTTHWCSLHSVPTTTIPVFSVPLSQQVCKSLPHHSFLVCCAFY